MWRGICAFQPLYRAVLALHFLLLVLLLISYPSVMPGTATQVVWVISATTLTLSTLLVGFVVYKCHSLPGD